ncbi:MAG TPA: condensation domain-containing protein, partial [Herpetosiphonaceae bacterium]
MSIDRAFNGSSFSADDLDLLELMLQQEGIERDEQQRIPRRDEQAPIPLSFAQERLWVLDQIEPDSYAYTIPVALRLSGRLNTSALQQSLTTIVERHEALRTMFELQSTAGEDQPVQVIVPPAEVPLPIVDLQALSGAERDSEVTRLASEEARRPFDLGRGPLFRATLLQLHPEGTRDEFVLLLSVHHIVFDGWSIMVFIRELATLYTALAGDRSGASETL